jgi:hypothetical protein
MNHSGGMEAHHLLFSTSVVNAGMWSASFSCNCKPSGEETTIIHDQEAGWASELVWGTVRKVTTLLVHRSISDRSAYHCTEGANPVSNNLLLLLLILA